NKLSGLDIPVDHPLDTGCVGVLEGGQTGDRVVALRADIDALPINEEGSNKQDFLSVKEGVAHCCGHDAYNAILLGTANLLEDIDEMPINEEVSNKQDFLSVKEGVAHCCGHDAHTANLLGTAHILADIQDQIEGTVLLIFQPGEETLPGGGRLLCETGYLQKKG